MFEMTVLGFIIRVVITLVLWKLIRIGYGVFLLIASSFGEIGSAIDELAVEVKVSGDTSKLSKDRKSHLDEHMKENGGKKFSELQDGVSGAFFERACFTIAFLLTFWVIF